jgi:CMP/dCMP kinase
LIIAIDGPAGSGKSTTARAVAARLGFLHLDSGALYRALTAAALDAGMAPAAWSQLDRAALDALGVEAGPARGGRIRVTIAGREPGALLRSADVTHHVSVMAQVPQARDWVNDRLRRLGGQTDVVAEGRDIGTVVFPGADLKVFLTASVDERARRRMLEGDAHRATPAAVQAEAARLARRDQLDSLRDVAPLRQAPDAVVIDTTGLDFDAQVERVVQLARSRGAAGSAAPAVDPPAGLG